MGLLAASLFLAAASSATSSSAFQPTKAVAPAQALVRILPGVQVNLSARAENGEHKLTSAVITVEDGNRRPARLVEFQ